MKGRIHAEGVSKRYAADVWALRDVALDVEPGDWVAIMGPSGSGKTTLLNLLAGLDHATEGRIEVAGQDITRLDQAGLTRFRRENVGLVFQQFHLIPYLTALENVMVAQYYHSMPDAREAAAALERVGLGHRLRHLPAQLSGGEQQRVCIARAVINSPALLLADEPTGNLDAENAEIVLRLFAELHEEKRTILMVTHAPHVAEQADRRVDLAHGRIVSDAAPALDEERYDHFLEELWLLEEDASGNSAEHRHMGDISDQPRLLERLVERGLLVRNGVAVHFTPRGAGRASDVVRRRRLAERLFADSFRLPPEEFESGGCRFEHILSPAATESICRFLGHPTECPHGRRIPPGACCPGVTVGADGGVL